jgi:alpha-aminoadipic semialdehyde synthase
MMDLKCNLIDYEKITNDKGFRLVFFGRYAGLAGMIDTLWSYGQRLKKLGIDSSFNDIKKTVDYTDLDEAKENIKKIGDNIKKNGMPKSIVPLIIGFAGYGHVSNGAQEILDLLPTKEISPKNIKKVLENPSGNHIYKIVFKEEDMVETLAKENKFELQDYYDNPNKYKSIFKKYLSDIQILINCIYWDDRYPRLVEKSYIKNNFNKIKLKIIGDISVDINGAIEFTEKSTTPENPSYIYNPDEDKIKDSFEGKGIIVMAVDNLPCELPKESSNEFSDSLYKYVSQISKTDFTKKFEELDLTSEIKNAIILYHGELTPNYQYIDKFL